ncbi:transglutaminase-like domain-containing protein [Marivirga sp.]|uniref:transglutaminase-like domain-containing protein n=1 Tax=Marivirga sp. TaxID=2018662 RepID=UPI0025E5D9C1|nr:transglutaminase-like domain-containing protein [Marivirga sp.]
MQKFPYLVFFLLLSVPFTSLSQKYPFKVGKVDKEDMAIDSCGFYPEASSMIIAKYGDLKFRYNRDAGWQYRMEVGVRKKIFSITDAADAGNIKIRAYEPDKGGSKEDIGSIKAYSHNIVNGEVESDKLKRRDVFKKRINDNWVEYSFAIPNIKEGSIVDYSYIVTSDYLSNLTTWRFQEDIPVALNDFRYTLPEWFNYQSSQLGNVVFADHEVENQREEYTISWSNLGVDGKMNRGSGTLTSTSSFNRFIAKDIMPLEDEPYMNNKGSVPGRLEFQLVSTNFPNQTVNIIAGNYPKFNEELCKNNSFGVRLKRGRFIKDLELSSENPTQQAKEIYHHLQNHFDWNEKYTFLSEDAGRTAYNNKEGNVADINLSFIAALRENGIEAYPVILSTRGHGIVHPIYPSYGDFNYVIAFINIDGKGYFCDAASNLPFSQLPIRCRNGKGWLVSEEGGSWVELKQNSVFNHTTMVKTEITPDSIVSHVTKRDEGYAAFETIKKIDEETIEKYKENIVANYGNGQLTNIEISDIDLSKPVDIKYDVHKKVESPDIIYLEIPTIGTIKENPFKKENRFSPIDFAYQQNYRLFSTFTIPEGYTAELPESALIKLPGDNGQFIYHISQNGNTINLRSDIFITKTDFSPQEYPQLKQFFELIEKKHAELIVLKK